MPTYTETTPEYASGSVAGWASPQFEGQAAIIDDSTFAWLICDGATGLLGGSVTSATLHLSWDGISQPHELFVKVEAAVDAVLPIDYADAIGRLLTAVTDTATDLDGLTECDIDVTGILNDLVDSHPGGDIISLKIYSSTGGGSYYNLYATLTVNYVLVDIVIPHVPRLVNQFPWPSMGILQ